jgi:hypothetical protein
VVVVVGGWVLCKRWQRRVGRSEKYREAVGPHRAGGWSQSGIPGGSRDPRQRLSSELTGRGVLDVLVCQFDISRPFRTFVPPRQRRVCCASCSPCIIWDTAMVACWWLVAWRVAGDVAILLLACKPHRTTQLGRCTGVNKSSFPAVLTCLCRRRRGTSAGDDSVCVGKQH